MKTFYTYKQVILHFLLANSPKKKIPYRYPMSIPLESSVLVYDNLNHGAHK